MGSELISIESSALREEKTRRELKKIEETREGKHCSRATPPSRVSLSSSSVFTVRAPGGSQLGAVLASLAPTSFRWLVGAWKRPRPVSRSRRASFGIMQHRAATASSSSLVLLFSLSWSPACLPACLLALSPLARPIFLPAFDIYICIYKKAEQWL